VSKKLTALAVGAHPDDVEFVMAGTLSLLARAGFEPHILTVANGSGGTVRHTREQIIRIRRKEAQRSAEVIGATHHPALADDLMVFYEDKLSRMATAVVREVAPAIVLLPSLNDYMEDHMISGRLIATACFVRGIKNYISMPPRKATMQDVYLYHAQPAGNRDGMRNLVVPSLFVDISSEIETKEEMLRRHASQKEWLDASQGMDSYLSAMREACSEVARLSGRKSVRYAEGFRQHSYLGYSAQDKDLLSEALGKKVTRGKKG